MLRLLIASDEQKHQLVAFLRQVDAVTWAYIETYFGNMVAYRFQVSLKVAEYGNGIEILRDLGSGRPVA